MLTVFTVLLMLIVAYAYFREGLYTSLLMLLNTLLAGIIAFNFWEPVADVVDPPLQGTFVEGYEDFLLLFLLFAGSLSTLRIVTNNLSPTQLEFSSLLNQIGAGVLGLGVGYLAAGFLICLVQTLPWHESFMGFEPRHPAESAMRRYLPADRAWLALMRHAGAYPLSWTEDRPSGPNLYDRYRTFDRDGTFELRYLRYRRFTGTREPIKYQGELDQELSKTSS